MKKKNQDQKRKRQIHIKYLFSNLNVKKCSKPKNIQTAHHYHLTFSFNVLYQSFTKICDTLLNIQQQYAMNTLFIKKQWYVAIAVVLPLSEEGKWDRKYKGFWSKLLQGSVLKLASELKFVLCLAGPQPDWKWYLLFFLHPQFCFWLLKSWCPTNANKVRSTIIEGNENDAASPQHATRLTHDAQTQWTLPAVTDA